MSIPGSRIPFSLRLAVRFLPEDVREEVLGDLLEHWNLRVRDQQWLARLAWAWRQPVSVLVARLRFSRGSNQRRQTGGRLSGVEDFWRSLRLAVRSLRRTPGVSVVIVFALALGIGACAAIYSVARAVVVDAVPFPDPQRLFSIELSTQGSFGVPSLEEFQSWESHKPGDVELAAYTFGPRTVGSAFGTVEAFSLRVTGNFFGILRPELLLGRALLPSDAVPGSPSVAVISDRLWRELFGSDRSALASTIYLGGRPYALAGVLKGGQEFPAPVDIWVPLFPSNEDLDRGVSVIGRVAGGSDPERVESLIQTLHRGSLEGGRTESRAMRLPLTGRENEFARPALWLLGIAVGSILAIGIGNAAGLVLTRSLRRSHEMAVRASLGAGRRQIVTQLFTESLVIACLAAAAGVLVAYLMLQAIERIVPVSQTRQMLGWEQLGLDSRVLGFSVVLALFAGAVCGLVPAIGIGRKNLTAVLRNCATRATSGKRSGRVLSGLVVCEVALSLSLLLSAGLLVRNFSELVAVEPGFATENVLFVSWTIPEELATNPEEVLRRQDRLVESVTGLAGIESVALTSSLPAAGAGFAVTRGYRLPTSDPETSDNRAGWRSITPGYLRTLGIPLVAGREFAGTDGSDAQRVALVSEALAQRHWQGGGSPVGRELVAGEQTWTIIGVVGDVHTFRPGENVEPTIYVPQAQFPTRQGFLALEFGGVLGGLPGIVREELWTAQPEIALGDPITIDEAIDELFAGERVLALLVAIYAVTALLITLTSLYAVVGHLVVRHDQEYGIRVALGAHPHDVLRQAMWRGMRAAVLGVAGGVILAAGIARLSSSLLYGIEPLDPVVFGGLPLLLLILLSIAAYLPARRASRTDPVVTLWS